MRFGNGGSAGPGASGRLRDAVGNSWDNAVAESFFATLEHELILRRRWATRAEARQATFRYIESWYNLKRRHPILDFLSPAVYEAQR